MDDAASRQERFPLSSQACFQGLAMRALERALRNTFCPKANHLAAQGRMQRKRLGDGENFTCHEACLCRFVTHEIRPGAGLFREVRERPIHMRVLFDKRWKQHIANAHTGVVRIVVRRIAHHIGDAQVRQICLHVGP